MNLMRETARRATAAARPLLRARALSATVIVMLALGIGATAAIFSIFYEVLMRPLPVAAAHGLVNLGAPGPKTGITSCGQSGDCEHIFSYPMFRDLEAQQSVFSGIAAHREFEANLSLDTSTVAGTGVLVSGSYFGVLGLRPAAGRLIAPQDEPTLGESHVVVLSHDYWQRDFGGDPGVVGRQLTVNGQTLTIVGIAPKGFDGTTLGLRPQVFLPLTLRWLVEPWRSNDAENRRSYWLYVFARLAPGISLERASAGINRLYSGILNDIEAPLNSVISDDALERFKRRQITLEPGARGQSAMPAAAELPLTLLLALTVLVLLIVCFNVASLLLARGASRAGEMAIRVSLGASRRRLIVQQLGEATFLALGGGIASLPVAAITIAVIADLLPAQLAGDLAIHVDSAALAFAAGATLTTVLLCGLVPALRGSQTDPGIIVKGQQRHVVHGRALVRILRALATTQVGLSLVLLMLTGLFAQSLVNIARVDLGMNLDALVSFTVSPRRNGYSPQRVTAVLDRIEEALAGQPGVSSVGSARIALITDRTWNSSISVDGFEPGPAADTDASANAVGGAFFHTLDVSLLAGREFNDADSADSARVAIVNESFVRKFQLGNGAVGAQFSPGGRRDLRFEIVGVVADSKYSDVKGETPAQFYLPRSQQRNLDALTYYVRGAIGADALMGMIPRVVGEIDPDLPVTMLVPMQQQVRENVYLDRLITALSAGFAGLATLLAAIGLYGVLANNVTQRTRELGLRLALGAAPSQLRALVLRQVGAMAAIGASLGVVAALVFGRAAETLLFGLSGDDPAVLVGAVLVLGVVVLAAAYLPVRRAATIAPMEALRYE